MTALTPETVSAVKHNHRGTTVGPDYRQHQVSVEGGQLTVGVWGPQDPAVPTVLAVHGVTASHRSFGLLAAALPGVRIVAPDLRGRGRSNHAPGPYGMPVHADDLARVLHETAAGPAVVAGHSMGAFAALVLAHRHPDLVREVVLVDGGIPLNVPEGLEPDQVVQAVLGPASERLAMRFDSVDEYRAFWQQHPAFTAAWTGPTSALMEDYITYDLDLEDGALRPATRYEAMAQDTAELQGDGSLLAAIRGLSVPATLLWSRRGLLNEEPGLYTPDYLESWRTQTPALDERLRTEEIAGTNHYSILMSVPGAERVAGILTELLARQPTGEELSAPDAS